MRSKSLDRVAPPPAVYALRNIITQVLLILTYNFFISNKTFIYAKEHIGTT